MADIPVEVLQEIASHIDGKPAFLALRLVSSTFNMVFTPFVFHSFQVTLGLSSFELWSRHQPDCDRSAHPKGPIPKAFAHTISVLYICIELSDEGEPSPTIWGELAQFSGLKELWVGCISGIGRYGRTRALEATPVLSRLIEVIADATKGCLVHLKLNLTTPLELRTLPDALSKFNQLRSFTLERCCNAGAQNRVLPCTTSPPLLAQLQSIITNNTSLEIFRYTYGCKDTLLSLHHVFPPTLTTMNVRYLTIFGALVSSTIESPLPDLGYLQHLELVQGKGTPVSNIDHLWHSLKAVGTSLKKIVSSYVSLALVEYLASFRGLHSCTLHLQDTIDPAITTHSFNLVLSVHCSTLEILYIIADTNELPAGCDGFIISPNMWTESSAFKKLNALSIPCSRSLDPTLSNLKLLRDFLSEFPSLSSVTIQWFGARIQDTHNFPLLFFTRTGRPESLIIEHNSDGHARLITRGRALKTG
ncbi:hypothetical protein AX16_006752 [Volvariella volvacea WC 439]|nr:hypothetical protein AX16_006752 [Volvariella volvacea WC 439]